MNAQELIAEMKEILSECLNADPGAYILGENLHTRIQAAIEIDPTLEQES